MSADPGITPATDEERLAQLGYKLTKYLTGMTFTRERPGGYWEDQGYPWFAGV